MCRIPPHITKVSVRKSGHRDGIFTIHKAGPYWIGRDNTGKAWLMDIKSIENSNEYEIQHME